MELGTYTATYIGKDKVCGFNTNKTYLIKIKKKSNNPYEVIELENDLYILYSSEISLRQNWIF